MCFEEMKILQEHASISLAPHYDGVHSSIIYTHQGSFYSKETVDTILAHYCLTYGSTKDGRLQASRYYLGFVKNPPILISGGKGIAAFQVPSPDYKDVMWILDLDFKINRLGPSLCEIVFNNQLKFKIQLSEKALRARKAKVLELLHEFRKKI